MSAHPDRHAPSAHFTHFTRRSLLLALAGGAAAARAQTGEDAALQAALAGSHRSAANRARDAARNPYATLRFFGLQPTHTVVEAAPGGGWYTELLAPYLRERGRLLAAHYAPDDAQAYRRKSREGFQRKLDASPALYDRVVVGTLPQQPRFTDLQPAGGADLVLTFRNVHNWIEDGHLDQTLHAFAQILKPGGVLGVVDHRAAPGTPPERVKTSGYVPEDLLITHARSAGFALQARSEINANARDSRDHPHGVWSLPPTLRGGDADRARFLAIGDSDRFTHRYVKTA